MLLFIHFKSWCLIWEYFFFWRLKWAFLITCFPSDLSVCLSVCNIFSFLTSSPEPDWANFNKTWHKAFLGEGNMKFVQKKGHALPQGEIITHCKIKLKIFKIFFSRTTEPISTKLGTTHPWLEGIKFYYIKGPHLSPRRDNS